jgi:HEAT repeat protein
MNKKILLIAAAAAAVLTLGIYAWFYGWFSGEPSPARLERRALTASTEAEQAAAASKLAGMGPQAREHLQRTYRQSQSPRVRAASVMGLGAQRDYESIELLFEAAQDDSPEVRRYAGVSLKKMLGVDMGFRANDPPEKRAAVLEGMRQAYEEMKKSGMLDEWLERMNRKD